MEHRQATIEDACMLAEVMRRVDRNAIIALGEDPEDMIATSINASVGDAWVATINGMVAGAWGIVPASLVTGWAVPWLLTTRVVDRYPKVFYKESRRLLGLLIKHYSYLANVIDTRNEASIRWALRLGFTLGPPVALGPRKQTYQACYMKGE